MEFGPILRALLRNKLGVMLIALQIAFTMTVTVNAVYIIDQRSERMARPSGLDEANIFHLSSVGYGNNFNESVASTEDLALIKALPGVVDATVMNAIPVSGSGSSTGVGIEPDRPETSVQTAMYTSDENVLNALGLNLVSGRAFSTNDVRRGGRDMERSHSVAILTTALAERIYPGEGMQAVGRTIHSPGGRTIEVIGLVERLQTPWPESSFIEQSMLIPEVVDDGSTLYIVRTVPGERDRIMTEVEELLAAQGHERILRNNRAFEETRENSYRLDSVMATILYVVIGTLMFITAMGIVGLAVFSINRRRKQIGTRRALGATRPDILRYFLLENLLISGSGVVLGAVLTLAFNMFLVQTFDMPRIDWFYAPVGMLLLIILGQLASLAPAAKASGIAPALATRSV